MDSIKMLDITPAKIQIFFALSVLLSLPTIILGENILFTLPLLLIIILSFILDEKFIISIIIISLFILVGDVGRTLRQIVYLVDFSLLGYFFLSKYGLNFKSYPKIPKSLKYFLILYYSTMIISAVMSDYPFAGIGLMARQMALFIIAYVFYSLINSINDIKQYFNSIYVVGFILVTFSLLAFSQGEASLLEIFSPDRPRVSAIMSNLEASTNFYVVSFPFIISTLLLTKLNSVKKLNYFLLIYLSIGLILAMSRSALIGIIFSTAIIFFINKKKRFYQLLIGLSAIVLSFFLIQPLNDLLTTFLRIESGVSARDYIWKMSVDMINDNFLFGVGPGAYKYEMLNYFPYMLDNWWGKLLIYFYEVTDGANLSHNFFLTFFTEMGVLGFITAVSLPFIYLRIGIKTLIKYKKQSAEKFYLVVALFAAGCSIILRNFFNGIGLLYVGGIQTDLPFWLIFGSLIYFYQSQIEMNS